MARESIDVKLTKITGKLDSVKESVDNMAERLKNEYVTKDQLQLAVITIEGSYSPIKKTVFWLLGIVGVETVGLVFFLIKTLLEVAPR